MQATVPKGATEAESDKLMREAMFASRDITQPAVKEAIAILMPPRARDCG